MASNPVILAELSESRDPTPHRAAPGPGPLIKSGVPRNTFRGLSGATSFLQTRFETIRPVAESSRANDALFPCASFRIALSRCFTASPDFLIGSCRCTVFAALIIARGKRTNPRKAHLSCRAAEIERIKASDSDCLSEIGTVSINVPEPRSLSGHRALRTLNVECLIDHQLEVPPIGGVHR